ncbi:hypothetical protein VCUG_00231 [Vavraia culicis subsp. floridensis]|uniref:Bromo domain-containing protein n=1 Tax=Vavraia culicis (isolate floridensis) TaxID=948595 RepID=L2GYL2_VAVCU|nr:uncharacterized protein VCUG_00231 [Vavraia culicis subsp. floridensis]ELA48190.1 hypothetical protein VCUG_00231 [Vavraia culicis subsp. floridensis]
MELHRQTIYLFIDPGVKRAYGYTECTIEGVCELTFKVGMLKIESVHINDEPAQYKINTDTHIIDENERVINKALYSKVIDHKHTLTMCTAHGMSTVRMHFVPNVRFYERLPGDHKHEEVLGMNGETVLFPYLDGMAEYTMVYVVPPDFTVVSPGQLVGVIEHCECIVHTYTVRAFAENVCFAVGSYEAYEISAVKTLYVPRYTEYADLKSDLNAVHKFVNNFVGGDHTLPLSIVFTMMPCTAVALHVAVLPMSTFPTADDIEHNFAFKERVARLIGTQLFMNTYFEREDLWLKMGLIGYVADHILKHMLGTNEFLFRLRNAIDAIVRDDHLHLPLYAPARTVHSYRSAFVCAKAAVFMHILENNTSLAFMQKIVKICLNRERINTHAFIGVVRDVTGKDLRNERMIYRNNSGTYTGEVSIDLKKNQVKIVFNGPVNTVVQSHEVEGVYEHNVKKELTYTYHNRRKKDEESVLFIRVDPYITQLNTYKLVLKGTMYGNLTRDKNVLSQMEGIKHVDECELERLVYDVHVNYRIKLMAMHYLGINSILSFFVKKFCVQGSTIIKPNMFTVLNHQVLVGTMRILSMFDPHVKRVVNEKVVSVGAILKAFFYNVLRYNDNSSNAYDDSVFVGQLIRGLSFMLTVHGGTGEDIGDNIGEGVYEGVDGGRDSEDDEIGGNGDDGSTDRIDNTDRTANADRTMSANHISGALDGAINKTVSTPHDTTPSTVKNNLWDRNDAEHREIMNKEREGVIDTDRGRTGTNHLNTTAECDDIYLEIIERYRMKDIIFPSNCNRVTCAVLYFYGRLDLYGMVNMNINYLLLLIRPANFIEVRCAAAEILTFKIILDDEEIILSQITEHSHAAKQARHHTITYEMLDTMLRMDSAIQITVYKTINNLITCTAYNSFVKGKLDKSYFYDRLRSTEEASVREHILEVIYFLEGLDVEIRTDEYLEHELSSTVEDDGGVRIKVAPLVDLKVRLRVHGVCDGIVVRRIVPVKEMDGVVKLKVGARVGVGVPGKRMKVGKVSRVGRTGNNKTGSVDKIGVGSKTGSGNSIGGNDPITAANDTASTKNIVKNSNGTVKNGKTGHKTARTTDLARATEQTEWCFTDNAMISRIIDEFNDKMAFSPGITTEKDLRAFLTHVFVSEDVNTKSYALARTVYNELERAKLEIPLVHRMYTPLTDDQKHKIKKLLNTLTIPQFSRPKNYKDITRKPKTVYSLKRKLDGIVVLEFFKLEVIDFIEKCALFTPKRNFNEKSLLSYLYSIPESKHVSVYELLEQCFELIKTKKVCAEFIDEVKVDGYDTVVCKPMYLNLIVRKLKDMRYGCVLDVYKDVELIAANAALFNGENSVYAADSKHIVKWFKRIVGGMLGDLYNDVD